MMLLEPSSQVLAVRFGLVVGEREWSAGTERSEWRRQSVAKRRGAESQTEGPNVDFLAFVRDERARSGVRRPTARTGRRG